MVLGENPGEAGVDSAAAVASFVQNLGAADRVIVCCLVAFG